MNVEISVVVEWENVLLAREERALRMLAQLAEQVRALARAVEILVVCDPAGFETAPLEALLADRLGGLDWRIATAERAHYYELKNAGAAAARGALVVFLDSDVVPEAGWLAALVAAFDDPAVQVVAGHSYVDPEGLYGRAMALGWFFPLRSEQPVCHDRGTHFWANNVAFRRAFVLAHPFARAADGSTRGACADLSSAIRREGTAIRVTTAAQVHHPPPNGVRHFTVRAIAHGRDDVCLWLRAGKKRWKLPVRIVKNALRTTTRAFGSIARHRRSVGLPLAQVPPAWGIVGAYNALALAGALATWIAPRAMATRFRV